MSDARSERVELRTGDGAAVVAHRFDANGSRAVVVIAPAEAGGPVGHLGFFRSRHRDTLWPIAAEWLDVRARMPATSRGNGIRDFVL